METRDLPDDLPPVKPPSMAFIFQLFVVPALIVAAVVAVWVLFGRLATGEQDWESLLVEVGSPNRHIRYRAMTGLAQVLDADSRLGSRGKQLSHNSRIAQVLADELTKKLASVTMSDETLKDAVFLTRAMGAVDSPELTLPPLIKAMDPARDIEVRKGAIFSVIFIAGRAQDRNMPLNSPELSDALIAFSRDSDPHLRRPAAYALGLVESDAGRERLLVLAEDADWMTAVNAAAALSRQGSTAGYPILKEVLAGKVVADPETPENTPVLELTIFHNVFKAVSELAAKWNAEQKAELIDLLTRLANGHKEVRVRAEAQTALSALQRAP